MCVCRRSGQRRKPARERPRVFHPGPRCQPASDAAAVKGAASAVREAQAEHRVQATVHDDGLCIAQAEGPTLTDAAFDATILASPGGIATRWDEVTCAISDTGHDRVVLDPTAPVSLTRTSAFAAKRSPGGSGTGDRIALKRSIRGDRESLRRRGSREMLEARDPQPSASIRFGHRRFVSESQQRRLLARSDPGSLTCHPECR